MSNTVLRTLLIGIIVVFSLISCGGSGGSNSGATGETNNPSETGAPSRVDIPDEKGTPGEKGTPDEKVIPGEKGTPDEKGTPGEKGTPDEKDTGGAGSSIVCPQEGWVEINDVDGLKAIGNDEASMAKNYCLTDNINLDGVTSGFPIGWTSSTVITPFTGNLDGKGNTISNLVVNRNNGEYIGLFAKIQPVSGEIKEIEDLILDGFEMRGASHMGALAGHVEGNVAISKVIVTDVTIHGIGIGNNVGGLIGSIKNGVEISEGEVRGGTADGRQASFGGLVGGVESSTISNSYASIAVNGEGYYVGGLIGNLFNDSTASSSYATGVVTGKFQVGGLIGLIDGTGVVMVLNSYATGDVTGKNKVGGIVGLIEGNGAVSNSYATGKVMSTGGTSRGGLVGELTRCTTSNCSVTSSYFDKSVNSGIADIGNGKSSGITANLVGVSGVIDIEGSAGGGFQRVASPNDKIFVDWDINIWQIVAGAWPTLIP